MAISVLVMLALALLLLLWDLRNKYFLFFALMLLGMSLAMTTLLVEISKASNYLAQAGTLLGSLEGRVYNLVRELPRLSLSALSQVRLAGIAVYMVTMVFYVHSFQNSLRHDPAAPNRRARRLAGSLLLLGVPLMVLVFYHPGTAYALYRHYYSLEEGRRAGYSGFIALIDLLAKALVALYLAYPPAFLVRNHLRNKITFFSEQLVALALSLALINLLFFALFFASPFSPSTASVFASGFWRYQPMTWVPALYTTYLPAIAVGLSAFLLYIITRFKTNQFILGMKQRGVKKNLGSLYTNVRNMLHSNKNLLFSLRIQAEDILANSQEERSRAKAARIVDICQRNLDDITRTLNSIKQLDVKALQGDFMATVEEALSKAQIPPEVLIERDFHVDSLLFPFDRYHLAEALGNVLSNSADALALSERENPLIRLTLYQSNDWVYFSIFDNGGGVPKKLVRKIHKPYVTTKSRGNSWGIGLAYVFSVIQAHYGHIRVRSKEGENTVVEILLPNKQREAKA